MLSAIWAMIQKDLKVTMRNPVLLILSIVVPVVFIFLYSLVIQLSATNPIVVTNASEGEASEKLVDILSSMHSIDGPYFNLVLKDSEEAFDMYNSGKIEALIEIPESFDADITGGRPAPVHLHVYNINSDSTKNYELRLSHALYLFEKEMNGMGVIQIEEEHSVFQHDISMYLYVGVGLLMFAVVYASMVNTGMLITREWEERTGKEVTLTPMGFVPLLFGKMTVAFIQTLMSIVLVILIMSLTIHFPLRDLSWLFVFWLFVLFLFGAAFGAFLAALIQKTLPVMTLSAVTGIGLYLTAGNESSIRGFAHDGMVQWLGRIAYYLPFSSITDHMRLTLVPGEVIHVDVLSLLLMLTLSFLFGAGAILILRKGLLLSSGQ